MNGKHIGKASAKNSSTNWERLRSLTDKEIRSSLDADPEVQLTDVKFWKKAEVKIPRSKQAVTIRLDADLIEWLRRQKGYQTRVNAVLRTYMEAQRIVD